MGFQTNTGSFMLAGLTTTRCYVTRLNNELTRFSRCSKRNLPEGNKQSCKENPSAPKAHSIPE